MSFFKDFQEGMKTFGKLISSIVNSIILLGVYVLGIGLTSLFARLAGKKFLQTTLSQTRKTYWTDLHLKTKPLSEYYRQF